MKKVTKFQSEDGNIFNTYEECTLHEIVVKNFVEYRKYYPKKAT